MWEKVSNSIYNGLWHKSQLREEAIDKIGIQNIVNFINRINKPNMLSLFTEIEYVFMD